MVQRRQQALERWLNSCIHAFGVAKYPALGVFLEVYAGGDLCADEILCALSANENQEDDSNSHMDSVTNVEIDGIAEADVVDGVSGTSTSTASTNSTSNALSAWTTSTSGLPLTSSGSAADKDPTAELRQDAWRKDACPERRRRERVRWSVGQFRERVRATCLTREHRCCPSRLVGRRREILVARI